MCIACNVLRINGVLCHEHGCPEAWKTTILSCKWCGSDFIPEERFQSCCSEDCAEAYNN